jgi:GT2 family glycosyltransferase
MSRPAPHVVSVIVPCHRGDELLARQLECLAAQDYTGVWEIVVADNEGDGQAAVVAARFAQDLPCMRVIDASAHAGASAARNAGARAAAGELLAFCDADDELAPYWLSELTAVAMEYDLVGGAVDESKLNDPASVVTRQPMGVCDDLITLGGFLRFAVGGNCAIWTDVFKAIGGWNERYPRANDVEFSWRAQVHGYRLGFAANALSYYRHRATRRELLRQFYGWGRADAQLYRDFRANGYRHAPKSGIARTWFHLLKRIVTLRDDTAQNIWLVDVARALGRLEGSIRFRVYFP